ncbi:MAG TPA: type II secretion system F family protein [Gemmatimonadaceae bacterium]
MPIPLIISVVLAVGALAVAGYAALLGRERTRMVGRAREGGGATLSSPILIDATELRGSPFGEKLKEILPESWGEDDALKLKLLRAGYDSPTAPLIYITVRVAMLVLVPLCFVPVMAGMTFGKMLFVVAWTVGIGWVLPTFYLGSRLAKRQERIRRSVPDALDLLVVCIEAGVSLDAAILRVAREIEHVHGDLALELLTVNRKTNAGVPREQALRGLYDRTGVEEVRALVSTMIQSEKWGTSIGHVLQVYAETLRRKRRQAVEKKAAVAPLKMLFPLILFILPALFAVVMGPAVIQIAKMFRNMGGG